MNRDASEVKVYEVKKRLKSRTEWVSILKDHDVIVAHPNSISPYYKGLSPVPDDLIDAVFIDEAHHEPAPTWNAINSFYKKQLKVFFTATPFRRDKKRMKAKMIYHYSLEQALKSNIIKPIEFHGIKEGNSDERTTLKLCEKAINVFKDEKASYLNTAILIRTNRIEEAKKILKGQFDKSWPFFIPFTEAKATNLRSLKNGNHDSWHIGKLFSNLSQSMKLPRLTNYFEAGGS